MFRVGQKVVLIDDFFSEHPAYQQLPQKGEVYTVAGYHPKGAKSIFLKEINNPWPTGCGQCCFRANRFRPIVERKTDISIFKAMLNPSKRKVSA